MTPDKLELITTLSRPSLGPDGRYAVVAMSRPSFDTDSYTGQLWLVDTAGTEQPRRLTRGTADAAPRVSPDGALIAFLRRDGKGRPQLAVMDARGGEPLLLTDAPLGVGQVAWSPDSRRLAFTARIPVPGRYGTLEGVDAGHEDARRITGFKYQMNGLGYVEDKRQGVFVLDVPPVDGEPWLEPVGRAAKEAKEARAADAGDGSGTPDAARPDPAAPAPTAPDPMKLGGSKGLPEARRLTPLDRDASDPNFSADGLHLYFTAALHDGADRDLRSMVHRVPVDGDPAPELVAGGPDSALSFAGPTFSRDGATLFLLGTDLGEDGTDFVARNTGVFALAADAIGSGAVPRLLTDVDAHDVGEVPLAPFGRSGVLAVAGVRGAGVLYACEPDAAPRVLLDGPLVVTGAAEADGTVVVTYADPTTPGEVGVVVDGVLTRLTDVAAPLREGTRMAPQVEFTAPDGYPVHGWVYLPEGDGPHPVLLNIHGGPYAEYGWGWFDEAQAYAAAGYAVVQCNPRGSNGYGREHGLAIRHAMGTVDMTDVLAFLDGAVAEFGLDGARVGIMGGSYGGYLTAWTIAHDHRFAAAIVERGYLDPVNFVGTSDIGWFFSDAYTGSDPERIAAQSPMAHVGQVRTPTLVMHSEQDLRCPLEQAQRYFAALLRGGVETEMLVFPGENHELSRSGSPWHRKQRFEAILDWWGRHLPVG